MSDVIDRLYTPIYQLIYDFHVFSIVKPEKYMKYSSECTCEVCSGYRNWLTAHYTNLSIFWNQIPQDVRIAQKKLLVDEDKSQVTLRIEPRTQKARGIHELYSWGLFKMPAFALVQSKEDVKYAWENIGGEQGRTIMGRPCPPKPVHGFVDSRPLKDMADLYDMCEQTWRIEPESEILLMGYIDATHNAVWTNGKLTIGPGHDGATSGHDSITYRTIQDDPFDMPWKSIKDNPFYEFVVKPNSKDPIRIVQLRDGPEAPDSPDYVPTSTPVEHVVKAEGDLLAWAETCKHFKPNTVVWHPGGNMASHYSIHCVLNKIPCVITYRPEVGQVLQPTTTSINEGLNKEAFFTGVRIGLFMNLVHQNTLLNSKKLNTEQAALFMLAVFHNYTRQDINSTQDAKLLGIALAFMIRLGFTASLGEARHAPTQAGDCNGRRKLQRETVYERALLDFVSAKSKIRKAWLAFCDLQWRGSFGGMKWADCTKAVVKLWNILCDVQADKADFSKLVEQWNVAVNMAHNGGWWFDKFCSSRAFDKAVNNPSRAAIEQLHNIYNMTMFDDLPNKAFRYRKIRKIKYQVQAQLRLFGTHADPKVNVQIRKIWGDKQKERKYTSKVVHLSYMFVPTDWQVLMSAILFDSARSESWHSESQEQYVTANTHTRNHQITYNEYFICTYE